MPRRIISKTRDKVVETGYGVHDWRIAVTNGELEYSYMSVKDFIAEWADVRDIETADAVIIELEKHEDKDN